MQNKLLSLLVLLAALALGAAEPAPAPAMATKIALISDTHVTLGTNYTLYARRLAQVIDQVNAAKVDLVLVAGDLTEDGKTAELEEFKRQIRRLEVRTWCVPGNHDVGNKILPGRTSNRPISSWRVRYYERLLGPSFYSRTHAGIRVIGINSPIIGSGFPQERTLWRLLEKELAQPSAGPTVLLSHYPVFVEKLDEKPEYWNISPESRGRLLALLKQGGVNTVLSGHLHRQIVHRREGLLMVTTIPVAFGLQQNKIVVGWTLVRIPAEGEASFEFRQLPD